MRVILVSSMLIWSVLLQAQTSSQAFRQTVERFKKDYAQLNIQPLTLSYVTNIQNVASAKALKEQQDFFESYRAELKSLSRKKLSEKEQLYHDILDYEIDLNLERIAIETQWQKERETLKGTRLYDEKMGKQWYSYFLKKWIDKELTPETAFEFGKEEIEKVKLAMETLVENSGLNKNEFQQKWEENPYSIASESEVLEKYKSLNKKVLKQAKRYFPELENIPPLGIEEGTNASMAIAPAYYYDNTFYYNFFDKEYDGRDMGWIYIHEGVPGHHYQGFMAEQSNNPLDMFYYNGYAEGWAAYIEQYGRVLGAYNTPFDTYAWMQWDLIRSMRVALDVGLNYYGWSDEEAFTFWQQYIPNKDDIARREIARMKKWPVQVISYKYGKQVLDELKGDLNTAETLKTFHLWVLENGNIPLSVLKQHVSQKQKRKREKESAYFAQRDSVLVCNVAFKDSTFNNLHAGSGFILRYKDKMYGITAKHVLFFAKTDSMKTISFGNQLQSWNFTSRANPATSILARKLLNENPEEAIEMPPKGDWLIFEIQQNIPEDVAVYKVREQPLEINEKVRFLGYPYNSEKVVSEQGTFIGFTAENNLKLDVPNGNYAGCSGGPVLDMDGNLVGIVSMGHFNQKEQKMIFEPASLDYFKYIITSMNDNEKSAKSLHFPVGDSR